MSTHKAIILSSRSEPMTIQSLPTPAVTPGSVLVSPLYSYVPPHTRFLYQNPALDKYFLAFPCTPGYVSVARVEAVGSDATTVKPGNLVLIDAVTKARDNPDTEILIALHGGTTKEEHKLMNEWKHGQWAQKALVPLENVHVIADVLLKSKEEGGKGYHIRDLTLGYLPILAIGGLSDANVGPGSTVIVAPSTGKFSGAGVLAALAMGAKVVAAGRNEGGLKKLEQFPGAKERLVTVKLSGDVEKDTLALRAAAGGKGADVFIDYSPSTATGPFTQLTSAINALRRGGQVVLLGGAHANIEVNYFAMVLYNITVKGKFMYEREHVERFLKMLEHGQLRIGDEVGMTVAGAFGLEDFESAIDTAEGKSGWGNEILLAPNGEI